MDRRKHVLHVAPHIMNIQCDQSCLVLDGQLRQDGPSQIMNKGFRHPHVSRRQLGIIEAYIQTTQ